jgi:hypothetical protein
MMGDLDVARGGQSLSTSTVLILTLIDPAVARAMGNAGMYQREFHVQMAGTLRVKVLGDRNGCVLTGEPKRFCIDGWIPNVRIAKVRAGGGDEEQRPPSQGWWGAWPCLVECLGFASNCGAASILQHHASALIPMLAVHGLLKALSCPRPLIPTAPFSQQLFSVKGLAMGMEPGCIRDADSMSMAFHFRTSSLPSALTNQVFLPTADVHLQGYGDGDGGRLPRRYSEH